MGFFRKRTDETSVDSMGQEMRREEIRRLEKRREELNREIEKLLVRYRRLTGDKQATLGARRIGRMKKDYSYWHKY